MQGTFITPMQGTFITDNLYQLCMLHLLCSMLYWHMAIYWARACAFKSRACPGRPGVLHVLQELGMCRVSYMYFTTTCIKGACAE